VVYVGGRECLGLRVTAQRRRPRGHRSLQHTDAGLEATVRPRHDIEHPIDHRRQKRAGVFDGQNLNRVFRNGSVETDAATVLGQHAKMGLVVRDDAFAMPRRR